jgi:Uncharacterized protein conserved in bacteria
MMGVVMTNDVLVSIKGLQFGEGTEQEVVETITPGSYYFKNGKHFVIYEETLEGEIESKKNIIKASQDILEIVQKGSYSANMLFEKNKKNLSYYNTPYGSVSIGITATSLVLEEESDSIQIRVEYALEVNQEYLADCSVSIEVKSKDTKNFVL